MRLAYLFQYQVKAEPLFQDAPAEVSFAWYMPIVQPLARIRSALGSLLAFVPYPVPETTLPWGPSYPNSLHGLRGLGGFQAFAFVDIVPVTPTSQFVIEDRIQLGSTTASVTSTNLDIRFGGL